MPKTVVITGTSTGIGRACVEKMAGAGWTVYAGVRKEADAEAISESLRFEVEGFGRKVSCVEPGEIATAIWEKASDQVDRMTRDTPAELIELYDHQVNMIQGFVAVGPRRGVPASRVADVVYHALTSPRPRHRYLVGPDARLTGMVTRMPDGIRHWALSQNIARWAKAGKAIRAAQR